MIQPCEISIGPITTELARQLIFEDLATESVCPVADGVHAPIVKSSDFLKLIDEEYRKSCRVDDLLYLILSTYHRPLPPLFIQAMRFIDKQSSENVLIGFDE